MGKAKRHHRPASAATPAAVELAPDLAWPALSGLRGLAALGVLLFHVYVLAGSPPAVPAPIAWLSAIGWSGVDVFFTLSAFLLTMPFVEARFGGRPEPALRNYWRRRAWRILPAYYVQLALLFAMALAGLAAAETWRSPDATSLVLNALFLYNIVPGHEPAIAPWWTLPVGIGFYLLLPWFARLLTPARVAWLIFAILASLAWRYWLVDADLPRAQEIAWSEHLPGRLHQFLVGMLAAWALVRWRQRFAAWSVPQRDTVASLAILAFLALPALALPSTGRPFDGATSADPLLLCWHLFASLLVAVLMIVLVSGPSRVGRALSAAWLGALGLISYSLYLWQVPVLLALRDGLGGFQAVKADFWPFWFQGLLFSLLAAAASWWLVERAARQRARRDKMPA